jgi:hypothetical protein
VKLHRQDSCLLDASPPPGCGPHAQDSAAFPLSDQDLVVLLLRELGAQRIPSSIQVPWSFLPSPFARFSSHFGSWSPAFSMGCFTCYGSQSEKSKKSKKEKEERENGSHSRHGNAKHAAAGKIQPGMSQSSLQSFRLFSFVSRFYSCLWRNCLKYSAILSGQNC